MTDANLYHTIRNSDGSWQSRFGLIEAAVSGGPDGFFQVSCAGVGDSLHVVGVGLDAQLYHTIRNSDGVSWQSFFGLIEGAVSGGPSGFGWVGCGGTGGALQLVGVGLDGQLYHTIRNADGVSWQNFFGLVEGAVSGGPTGFLEVSCAGVGGYLHVVGVGTDHQLWHTIRNDDGRSWQNFFGLVEGAVSGGPSWGFSQAGCAAVSGAVHLVGVGIDGQLWHTIRNADDVSWQNFFGLVEGVVAGGPRQFFAVGCAGVGDALHVVGIGTDYKLYHTVRYPDGSWQGFFGLVEGVVAGGPWGFVTVGSGGTGTALQVVGSVYLPSPN
jgi:uncharacterized protein YfiM (DUF2279 family)